MATDERLLTIAEVAATFRVHARTVQRWLDKGKLTRIDTPGGRLVRVRESEVRALVGSGEAG